MTIVRRSLLSAGAVVPLLSSGAKAATAPGLRVMDLRTDNITDPLGLENPRPRLSWKLASPAPDVRQGAYRITVARSTRALVAGDLVWDSGRVASARSVDVTYGGPALKPRERLCWRVQVWDNKGAAAASPVAWWEMGLLDPAEWHAGWTAAERPADRADREADPHWIWGESIVDEVSRKFRFHFNAPGEVKSAELLLVGKDVLAGIWLNGAQAVGRAKPDLWGAMVSYPLSGVARGPNLIAVEVVTDPKATVPYGGLVALLRLHLADGRTLRLSSGKTWQTSLSTAADWTAPTFDDTAWPAAALVSDQLAERKTRRSLQPGTGIMTAAWPPKSAVMPVFTPKHVPWPPAPAMRLRKSFDLSGPVAKARLYATALGAYEAMINGRRVGDAQLAPESTNFDHRALYQAYDVTSLVRPGANALGLLVGDGWYASRYTREVRYEYGPAPRRAMAMLELTYADGHVERVATGEGWRAAPSPILSSEIYNGEHYDARLEEPGWSQPAFNDSAWAKADTAEAPAIAIDAQPGPKIRRRQEIRPVSVRTLSPGVHVFDFGQNFAGWCRLKIRGAAGQTITLKHAEVLAPSGMIDQRNFRTAQATDSYTLRGDPKGEVWEPRFTYHGFRYVELTGLDGQPPADILTGIVVHSDLQVTGRLSIADPGIEQFWRNAVWSQRSNFVGLPTDCPQRDERAGWMGDINVFADAAAFNMDIDAFLRRFLADVREAQTAEGRFPDVVPPFSLYRTGGSPGWADAGVTLPWILWRRYGDTAVIAENWEALERWQAFLNRHNPDHLWAHERTMDFGDWLAVDSKFTGNETTPNALIATAFWARGSRMMAEMAGAIGKAADADRYRRQAADITAAFRRAFVQADGVVGNGSQTSQVLAIAFDLLTPGQRVAAGDRLAEDVRRRGMHLSTGFLGTPFILDALADTGHTDEVYGLLLQKTFPSWGYMVAKGATTMWERWNSDTGDLAMNSYNHYAFGAVIGFMFRRLAGIDAASPGFETIRIRPLLDPRVPRGGGDYESVRGRISTAWARTAGGMTLEVAVPANSSAEVCLPAGKGARVLMDGKVVEEARLTRRAGEAVVKIGSGSYRFEVRG